MEKGGNSIRVYFSYFQQGKKAGTALGEGMTDASPVKHFVDAQQTEAIMHPINQNRL